MTTTGNAEDKSDALFDRCEVENIQIRCQAVRELSLLCKDTMENIPKIADISAKLLVVGDPSKCDYAKQVHMSLQEILKIDANRL